MLVATPCMGYELSMRKAPRVISEIKKQEVVGNFREQIRPRISDELSVLINGETKFRLRKAMIRGGQLILAAGPAENCSGLRVPLRQLSLRAGPLPNSLCLVKGQNIILTLQTSNERSFDLWVKTIAIELIRQTPLDLVKYLDIFTITETNQKKKTSIPICRVCPPSDEPTDINRNHPKPTPSAPNGVEVLLQRCQNSENYVPVKEKLALFESLCRMGRVQSSEDVSLKVDVGTKRARSMHDLTYSFPTTGVREICKYFETKLDGGGRTGPTSRKRFINSDSNLSNKFTFGRNTQDVSYA